MKGPCLYCAGKEPPVPGASCKMCGRVPVPAKHPCHADGCDVEVPPRMFMCLRHWRMVPEAMKKRIWKEYVPGQEVKKNPTRAYLEAAREAIAAVAAKEA